MSALLGLSAMGAQTVLAANGDLVAQLSFSQACPFLGVGIAFDGQNLWYSCYQTGGGDDLFRASPTTGLVTASYNIEGGLGALAYDSTRNVIYGAEGGGSTTAILAIALDAAKSVTGQTVLFDPGSTGLVDGLGYDAADDSLYWSPDGSSTITHFSRSGTILGNINFAGSACYNSGVAIGGSLLYEGSDGCGHVWVVNKTTNAASFDFSTVVPGDAAFRDEGLTCDTKTFAGSGKHVMWSIEAYEPRRAAAFEIPLNSCVEGGGPTPSTPTAVSYTGPASVQYSDPLTLSGHLQTSGGTAIAGETIGFALGTDTKTAGPTNASGNASATPYNELQAPGSVTTVATSFAGDATYAASNDSDPFAITKEDCTLAYTGDTLVNASTNTNLSAQFGEPDTTPGDWTGKTVTFTVTDAALNVQTFTAVTNSAGVASTSVALGANVYAVGVSFAGDTYYLACASTADTIVTVQAANAKITGGGWISQGTGKTSFGFNVISDVTGLHGQLQIRPHGNKSRFHGTSVLTLNSSGNSGTWTGTGRWNGVTGYTFTISVVDNGTSGKKGDTISIVIKSPTNVVTFTTSGSQPLKGGNIVVH